LSNAAKACQAGVIPMGTARATDAKTNGAAHTGGAVDRDEFVDENVASYVRFTLRELYVSVEEPSKSC
jgi:hypothetical protein